MKQKSSPSKLGLRQPRHFSEAVKEQVVADIEQGKSSVTQASRELAVSRSTLYNWIYRYSRYLQKNQVLIVEEQSQTYRTKALEQRIQQLEAALGRKQLEVDFLQKLIELANTTYDTDLKKPSESRPRMVPPPP